MNRTPHNRARGVLSGFETGLIGFVVSYAIVVAAPAYGQAPPPSLPIQRGGQDEYGTGWVVNPYDIEDEGRLAAGWEVLCNPWPGPDDETGTAPEDCFLNRDGSINPAAAAWYQENLPRLFYRVPRVTAGASGPATRGATTTRGQGGSVGGAVRQANVMPWDAVVWNKDGLHGNWLNYSRVLGAYAGAVDSNTAMGLALAGWGQGFLPKISPTQGILVPGSEIFAALSEAGYGGRSRLDAYAHRPPAQTVFRGNPSEDLSQPRENSPRDTQPDLPLCNGQSCGGLGGNQLLAASRLGEPVGGLFSAPFGGLLGRGPFGNIFPGIFGNILQQLQNMIRQFGTGDTALFFGRFPAQTFAALLNRFGGTRLTHLLEQSLGPAGGGGGGRLDRPPRTTLRPASPACPNPRLTSRSVGDIADVMGLPRASEPWEIQFTSVVTLGTITGQDPETGQTVTMGPDSFPTETCVWTVRGGNEIVIISDRPTGGEIRLIR